LIPKIINTIPTASNPMPKGLFIDICLFSSRNFLNRLRGS
jgi:hypothetical protein